MNQQADNHDQAQREERPASTPTNNDAYLLKRRIVLQQPLTDTHTELLEVLSGLPGMDQVRPCADTGQLMVRYDGRLANIETVLSLLRARGIEPRGGWWQRLRLGWYAYVDSNAYRNSRHTDIHCCNKPPKGFS